MEGNGDGLQIEATPAGRSGTVALTVRLADEILAAEKVDLLRPKARADFAQKVCYGRPGIDAKMVEAELLRLAADLAKKPDEPAAESEGRPNPADLLAKMPAAVVEEARALLDDAGLMQRVVADVGRLGVAGEKELAAAVYLIGTSRLLAEPLASIVQGPTSSGKSYVIKKAASLFPPEAVLIATALTPQALYYMPAGSLRHRFVVVGERSRLENDDTAEATRALREMLSEGRLCKWLPIKKDGRQETVQVEQDGPIAYIESTTLTKVFDEDANRCILLTTDERPEQTRRVLDTLADLYTRGGAGDAQRIIDVHHALQRLLRPDTVLVPYAKRREEASKSSVYGWLRELHDAGLVEPAEAQRGNRAAKWQLSADAPDPEAAAVLPALEKVFP